MRRKGSEGRRMRNLRKPELLRDEPRGRKQIEVPGCLEGYTRGTKGRKGDRTQKMLTCWRENPEWQSEKRGE